jgi:hypothetical protein
MVPRVARRSAADSAAERRPTLLAFSCLRQLGKADVGEAGFAAGVHYLNDTRPLELAIRLDQV